MVMRHNFSSLEKLISIITHRLKIVKEPFAMIGIAKNALESLNMQHFPILRRALSTSKYNNRP